MRPKQVHSTWTSMPAAAAGKKQWQQRQQSVIGWRHPATEMFSDRVQGQKQEQRGETRCSYCSLPEARKKLFRSTRHVFPPLESNSCCSSSNEILEPYEKTTPTAACHPSSSSFSAAKPLHLTAAVSPTVKLVTYIFCIGFYCLFFMLEARVLLSHASVIGPSSRSRTLFTATHFSAGPAYRPPAGNDGPSRDAVAHCSGNKAADTPTPPSIQPQSSSPRRPLLASAGGVLTSLASRDFHWRQSPSTQRSRIARGDASTVAKDASGLSSTLFTAVHAASAAVKRLYRALYLYWPTRLQIWKLRYPQNTFPSCLNFPTVQQLSEDARAVRPALQRLKHRTFFRIFKLRLLAESCADTRLSELLNKRPDICTEPHRCGLCECSEDEVPSIWRQMPDEEFVDRRHAASFTRWTQHKSSRQPDDPFSFFKSPGRQEGDAHGSAVVSAPSTSRARGGSTNSSISTESRGVYVDLLLNPPMYTRYEGGDVWRFLYSQVPLPLAETASTTSSAAAASSAAAQKKGGRTPFGGRSNVGAAGEKSAAGPGEDWPLGENEHLTDAQLCSSNANLRRVLSGMQANIAALACENFVVTYPPNGQFDPHAAFPLLPTSTNHVPPSEGSISTGEPASAAVDAPQSPTSSSSSTTPWVEDGNTAAQTSVTSSSVLAGSPTPPAFGRNLSFFRERLAEQPLRVQNLYFVFGLLLRAVCSLSDVLQECSCETGHREEDLSARADLLHVLNITTISTHACSPRYMDQPLFDPDHLAFLSSMESTDSLLRCIPCEKCRLHGKIKLGALHVAGKVISSTERLSFLERNQVTALINALYYFADAIRVVEEMQKEIYEHNISVYVFFACVAIVLLLSATLYLTYTRSAGKILLLRMWQAPRPVGDNGVKKTQ